ncbi:MAG TPA: hypothetical protein VI794_02330 [Patescibacteria group bacterium]|nr:hypothetical protein [Patescibacteria group bacterium]
MISDQTYFLLVRIIVSLALLAFWLAVAREHRIAVLPFLYKIVSGVWGKICKIAGRVWSRIRRIRRSRKPKYWPLATRLAKAILSSGEVSEEVRPFTASPEECKNRKGDQHPYWKLANAQAYLRQDRLARILARRRLCASCLNELAKLVEKPLEKAAPVPADQGRDGKKEAKKVHWLLALPLGWIGITMIVLALVLDPLKQPLVVSLTWWFLWGGLALLPVSFLQKAVRSWGLVGVLAVVLAISALLLVLRFGDVVFPWIGLW